ncbi:MAG TPA: hypothetical protein VL422_08060 [Miltoncostaea sp.]|nr:hypothetical protein [Miltoncostaea sp.]
MGWRRTALPAAGALAIALAACGAAQAAIPASGVVREAEGPAAVTIGMPGSVAIARWHLVCAGRPTEPVRRCYSSLHHAVNWVEIDGAGRVQALVWGEGGWRTSHGVGLGSRIAAVKAAYRRALIVRTTPVWTYMTLRRTVHGQVRVTGFLGRTKVGDVVQMYVTRERRRLLSIAPPSVPATTGFAVVLRDWGPREIIDLDLRMPWDQGFGEDLGRVRVARDGTGRLAVGATGIVAQVLARRPAGTHGPVMATVVAGDRRATVALALPAPPALAVSPSLLPADGGGTVTVTGAEPSGQYEVDGEWTCPATGRPGRYQGVTEDPLGTPAGGTLTGTLDASGVDFALFDQACAGPAPPDALPATLALYRVGVRGGGADSRERVATAAVTVARPS